MLQAELAARVFLAETPMRQLPHLAQHLWLLKGAARQGYVNFPLTNLDYTSMTCMLTARCRRGSNFVLQNIVKDCSKGLLWEALLQIMVLCHA